MVGLRPGNVIDLIFAHLPAPSIEAASYKQGSIAVMAAR